MVRDLNGMVQEIFVRRL